MKLKRKVSSFEDEAVYLDDSAELLFVPAEVPEQADNTITKQLAKKGVMTFRFDNDFPSNIYS